jgi:hypothetical protein
MKTKIAAALALFVGLSMMATVAHADPPKREDGYEYKFKDDDLLGKDLGGNTPLIAPRKTGMRMLLQRPRTQFVQEMLKSVENL